jgi:hypothetical protein
MYAICYAGMIRACLHRKSLPENTCPNGHLGGRNPHCRRRNTDFQDSAAWMQSSGTELLPEKIFGSKFSGIISPDLTVRPQTVDRNIDVLIEQTAGAYP